MHAPWENPMMPSKGPCSIIALCRYAKLSSMPVDISSCTLSEDIPCGFDFGDANSRRSSVLSALVSHHARGVVSGVCTSLSVVADESKSSMLVFQGMSAFSTTIGGSRNTAISSRPRKEISGLTKLDVLACLADRTELLEVDGGILGEAAQRENLDFGLGHGGWATSSADRKGTRSS